MTHGKGLPKQGSLYKKLLDLPYKSFILRRKICVRDNLDDVFADFHRPDNLE